MQSLSDLELFARIALAALFGFVIGWERELRGSAAGNRTFALVCAGSSAFTVLGVAVFPLTAEKLIAGIVTGIGFIGAGLILHTSSGEAKGLTTAATVWCAAAVGVLAGGGLLLVALMFSALVVFLLELRYIPGLRLLDARRWKPKLDDDSDPEAIDELRRTRKKHDDKKQADKRHDGKRHDGKHHDGDRHATEPDAREPDANEPPAEPPEHEEPASDET